MHSTSLFKTTFFFIKVILSLTTRNVDSKWIFLFFVFFQTDNFWRKQEKFGWLRFVWVWTVNLHAILCQKLLKYLRKHLLLDHYLYEYLINHSVVKFHLCRKKESVVWDFYISSSGDDAFSTLTLKENILLTLA